MNEVKKSELIDDYTSPLYVYFCETNALNAALTDPVWTVSRLTVATGRISYASGNENIASNRVSLTYPS